VAENPQAALDLLLLRGARDGAMPETIAERALCRKSQPAGSRALGGLHTAHSYAAGCDGRRAKAHTKDRKSQKGPL